MLVTLLSPLTILTGIIIGTNTTRFQFYRAVHTMSVDRLKPKGRQVELIDDNLARSRGLKCRHSCGYILREAVQTEDGYRLCKECLLFILEYWVWRSSQTIHHCSCYYSRRPDRTCPTSGLKLISDKVKSCQHIKNAVSPVPATGSTFL